MKDLFDCFEDFLAGSWKILPTNFENHASPSRESMDKFFNLAMVFADITMVRWIEDFNHVPLGDRPF